MNDNIKKLLVIGLGSVGLILFMGIKFGWFDLEDKSVDNGIGNYERVKKDTRKKSNLDVLKEKHKEKLNEARLDKKVKSLDTFLDNAEDEDPFGNDKPEVLLAEASEIVVETAPIEQKPKVIYVPVKQEPVVKEPVKRKRRRRSTGSTTQDDGFYGSSSDSGGENVSTGSGFVKAVVHGDHQVRSGNNVNIRLTEDLEWNGKVLKKNEFLTGTAKLSKGRMMIVLSDILVDQGVVDVKANVYDSKDGSEGLYVPGGVDKEIKDRAVNDVIDETATRVNVPLIGSVKFGAKKKAKDPVVSVLNGHKILIKIVSSS